MNQDIKRNNEIDLMDLVKVFYRRRVMVISIIVISIVLSIGLAIVLNNKKKEAIAMDIVRKEIYIEKGEKVVLNNEVEDLTSWLEGKNIRLNKTEENRYKLSMEKKGNVSDKEKLLEESAKEANQFFTQKYKELLREKEAETTEGLESLNEELKNSNEKISIIFKKESKLFNSDQAMDLLKLKYPKEIANQKILGKKYEETLSKLNSIQMAEEELKNIYKVERKPYIDTSRTKAKLVLVGGIIFGIFLALGLALFLEFWKILKTEIAEEDRKKLEQ